ncbi:hypothetical protein RhiXN_06500 [Rhizoctonia solani]|uniref:Uncharacterized protein n=1 Tax=Rhizoctonia solani TaxID=456999 RepID=A0A8H8NWR0_9AGAM|nr:uncharacterized protein RhiXN_06500 [Rhizoctonia solani]QRW21511.1 hypothetical protein RhiXN_06500 [Rhizoctonia solani]
MVNNHEDPPWLRSAPILVVSRDTDEMNNPKISISPAPTILKPNASPTSLPATARSSDMAPQAGLLPSPSVSAPGSSSPSVTEEEEYVGWRPQQITIQQVTQTPPLSPLDLAMYPGIQAPHAANPVEARKAVTGLKPLRILSTRQPGGPASAGPSRRPSFEVMDSNYNSFSRSGIMGFFSAAKRASVAAISGPPSASSRASTQSISVAHTPIPVSPLPPPRTPPLVPKPSLAPELLDQMEPELRAHLEALAAQARVDPRLSSSSRPVSAPHLPQTVPSNSAEEEETILEIRDLNTGEIIRIRDLDAVPLDNGANRESQSTSQSSPNISDFMVIRDLDAQPRTPLPTRSQQRNRMPEPRLLTPPHSLTLNESHSPTLLAIPDVHQPRQGSPVTPLTEAVYVNRSLELSLSSLEDALSVARKLQYSTTPSSTFTSALIPQFEEPLRAQKVYTPKTARTMSSSTSSMFSSRMNSTPLTTPPVSPPSLPQRSKGVSLPCTVCSRPMQNMTSTRCGHVFCRGVSRAEFDAQLAGLRWRTVT